MRIFELNQQILDQIDDDSLTVEKGAELLISMFLDSQSLSFTSEAEERLSDKAASAIVQALKSDQSKINNLTFNFCSKRISQQIQFIVKESHIPSLSAADHEVPRADECVEDLAAIIAENPYLKSLRLTDSGFSLDILTIMKAVAQSNIEHLRLDFPDDLSTNNYKLICDYLLRSKIKRLEPGKGYTGQSEFLQVLPKTKITDLEISFSFLRNQGIEYACRNLRVLTVCYDNCREDDSLLLYAYLPYLNITHLTLEYFGSEEDGILAAFLAKSSVVYLNHDDAPLSQAAVQKNRQSLAHKVAFLMFQWMVPVAIEKNGFNILPKDVFLKILKEVMTPLNLKETYYKNTEKTVRKIISAHQFSPQTSNSRFTFFDHLHAEHMLRQQEAEINRLRQENSTLSRALSQLKQSLFSLMPILPAQALEELNSIEAFRIVPEEEPTANEPESKQLKINDLPL